MPRELAEPWRSFLAELDARVQHEVGLHCCGGFVVTTVYGLARTTADLDVLAIVPSDQQRELARLAGRGSVLHQTLGVYLDVVTVATLPDSYEDRLTELYPSRFRHLRLLALDPYDLVLAKITRNADRDRSDLEYLATAVPLDPSVLRDRYRREMRDYLGVPEREDLTLDLWIEIIKEARHLR
jgi:uncharacterized nucleotidyltransferase DUF6036